MTVIRLRLFSKLGHMIPLWKGKNPIYFGVITIIPFDNLYRRAYFVMHTFLVKSTKEVFSVQVTWQSPSMIPTMVTPQSCFPHYNPTTPY